MCDSDDDIEDDDEEEEEGEEDECILYKTEDSYIEMGQAKDSSDSDSSYCKISFSLRV